MQLERPLTQLVEQGYAFDMSQLTVWHTFRFFSKLSNFKNNM